MQDYELTLRAPITKSFMGMKAAQSVDLDSDAKATHHILIKNVDIETPWNVGVIYGASGSGKSTLAREIFSDSQENLIDPTKAVIDQFPEGMSYDDRVRFLTSIGLSQVPCWIKPLGTLSNGQQERAKIALNLSEMRDFYYFDEWTSVVDRNVAAAMSHTVQKFARAQKKRVCLISCHEDVIEWLKPDWLIDCNLQKYTDFRSNPMERKKKIEFTIREIDRTSWQQFKKYHYLSDNLPGGLVFFFGLFLGEKQVGFQCFAEYTQQVKGRKRILHFNRTVIHPDYVGFGLGMRLIDETSEEMSRRGYRIMGKFSSIPVFKSMIKNKKWVFTGQRYFTPSAGENMTRNTGFRDKIKTYGFEWIGQ